LRSLQNEDPNARAAAVELLGKVKTEAAIPILEQALQDNDLTVQSNAVEALKTIGTAKAINILEKTPFVQFDPATSTFFFDPLTPLIGSTTLLPS